MANYFNSRSNDQRNKKPCVIPQPFPPIHPLEWPQPGGAPNALVIEVTITKNAIAFETFTTLAPYEFPLGAYTSRYELDDNTWWQSVHNVDAFGLRLQGRQDPTFDGLGTAPLTAPDPITVDQRTSHGTGTFTYVLGADTYVSTVTSSIPRQLSPNLPPHTKGG